MSSDPTNQFGTSHYPNQNSTYHSPRPVGYNPSGPTAASASPGVHGATESTQTSQASESSKPPVEINSRLANELNKFNLVASEIRDSLMPATNFEGRCQQAFDVANDLFGNAPTWVCFYRALMGGRGLIHAIFSESDEFGSFLRTDQYYQIQMMLTALRSRDLPENDPNDPQRMITVRLPKSLHEAMCDEAGLLNISVNRLCISRMLQLLDPKMIPETTSKPRGRKPRTRAKPAELSTQTE